MWGLVHIFCVANALRGQKYVGTQTFQPYVIVEDMIPKPWALICCYKTNPDKKYTKVQRAGQ